jgi:hypothetical protein
MRRAVARNAELRESSLAADHIAVAVAAAAVVSAAVAAAVASATARRVRCTPRRARVVDGKHQFLSSRAKIARFTVAIVISPSRAIPPSALVLLADRAGSRHDTDYCEPQRLF